MDDDDKLPPDTEEPFDGIMIHDPIRAEGWGGPSDPTDLETTCPGPPGGPVSELPPERADQMRYVRDAMDEHRRICESTAQRLRQLAVKLHLKEAFGCWSHRAAETCAAPCRWNGQRCRLPQRPSDAGLVDDDRWWASPPLRSEICCRNWNPS